MPGKLRLKQQMTLLAAVTLLVLWGLAVLVFLPQRERLEEVRAECRRQLHAARVIEAFTLDHPDVEAYLTELNQKRLFVGGMLPDTSGLEEYLALLETAAKQSGVRLERVTPVESTDKGDYQELRLEVACKGSLSQILNFLKRIDEGPRFSIVSSAALHSNQGIMDGKMVVRIFCLNR